MNTSNIRIKNIEKEELLKNLKLAKARFLGSTLEKQLRFKIDQSEKFQNKNSSNFKGSSWLSINYKNGVSTIEIEESDFEGKQKDHNLLNVDDFLQATKMILTMMPKNDYDYLEIYKEIYWFEGATIVIEDIPALKTTVILSGSSKKSLLEVKKKLKINGTLEPNFNLNTVERYYTVRGVEYDIIKTVLKKKFQNTLKKHIPKK